MKITIFRPIRPEIYRPIYFPPGNFWELIGKIRQGKKVKKMGNVEENEEKWKKKDEN